MRVLAALVLLLQLQPLVGSAFCFHDSEMTKAGCTMPHEDRHASGTLTAPSTGISGGCSSMGYCAPVVPAVPKFAEHFQICSFVHGAPALSHSSWAPGEPLGPPFHPPKA